MIRLLLQAFYSTRSERQPTERLGDKPLFRWFAGLSMDVAVWDASTLGKNSDRLLKGDGMPQPPPGLASPKSFQPKSPPSPDDTNDPLK